MRVCAESDHIADNAGGEARVEIDSLWFRSWGRSQIDEAFWCVVEESVAIAILADPEVPSLAVLCCNGFSVTQGDLLEIGFLPLVSESVHPVQGGPIASLDPGVTDETTITAT